MPEQFGKYLLLDRINKGGMAEVYLAKAFGYGGTDQIIALKRILTGASDDPAFTEMFVNEAKLAVLLNHANIAQIYELGKHEANLFIAMEYVPGRDLKAVIDRANRDGIELPEHLVLHIVAQVLEGLDFAHRKADPTGRELGIVHQDVSPHNVLLSYGGAVKLIDFGIAKMSSTEDTDGKDKVLQGKYGYMSPEQVLGEKVDARSDLFAAGVVLWEALTQRRLFEGGSDYSVLEKVRYAEVYPPSTISPKVSPELERVVLAALTQDRNKRFGSASDMHDAVVEVMLKKYGHPTQRELASLMKSLFAREHKADLKRLDKAREYAQLPPVAEEEEVAVGDRREETVVDMTPRLAVDLKLAPEPSGGDTDPSIVAPAREQEQAAREGTEPHFDFTGSSSETVKFHIPEGFAESSAGSSGLDAIGRQDSDSRFDRHGRASRSERRELKFRPGRLAPVESKPRPGRLEPTDTKVRMGAGELAGSLQPTQLRNALQRWGITRDHYIVMVAAVVALVLVSVSWVATRGSPGELTGEVRIMSDPPGAVVILDDMIVGQTTFNATGVAVGRHIVKLELAGFTSETRIIEVASNYMLRVQLRLQPVAEAVPPEPPPVR